MKKLVLLILTFLLSFTVHSQCDFICDNTYNFTNNIGDNSNQYDINYLNNVLKPNCFYSESGTIGTNFNWQSWNNATFLYFNGYINVLQSINFGGANNKVYTNGNITLSYISMDGGDTIYNSGKLEILAIGGANNSNNTIMTELPIKYKGRTYDIGDTIIINNTINNSNYLSNTIHIVKCNTNNQPLPITLYEFKIVGNTISWRGNDVDKYILQGSYNSKDFYDVYISYSDDIYIINNDYKFFRLKMYGTDLDMGYSNILYYENKTFKKEILGYYNQVGQRIDIDNYNGIYLIHYNDNSFEKSYKY